MAPSGQPSDPLALLTTLERERVNYVLVGSLAGVLRGTSETSAVVEVCAQPKAENLQRLDHALTAMNARTVEEVRNVDSGADDARRYTTSYGALVVDPRPSGTNGYDDLRRQSSRELVNDEGLRVSVASVGDLVRTLRARNLPEEAPRIQEYRRLLELTIERERSRGIER